MSASDLLGALVQSGAVRGKVVSVVSADSVEVLTSDERLVTLHADHVTVLENDSIPGEPVPVGEPAVPVVDGIPGEPVESEPAAVPDASFIAGVTVGDPAPTPAGDASQA